MEESSIHAVQPVCLSPYAGKESPRALVKDTGSAAVLRLDAAGLPQESRLARFEQIANPVRATS